MKLTAIEQFVKDYDEGRLVTPPEGKRFVDVVLTVTLSEADARLAADCIARVREEAQRQEAIVQAGRTRRHPGFVIDFEAEIEALRALAARIGEAGDG